MTASQRPWKAFVFDFDGTLARQDIDFGVMRTRVLDLMSRFNIPFRTFAHLHVLEMIAAGTSYLSGDRPTEASRFFEIAHAEVTQIETAAAKGDALFAYTRGLLDELQRRLIKTGVITRNCRQAVLKVFPDIERHCQVLLTRSDIDRVKPHPDHLSAALRFMGVPPSEAVMVGDHPMDIQLGRNAGTYTIGVLTGHSSRALLLQAGADIIIADISEIIDIISFHS